MEKFITIISLLVVLVGCQKILFDSPMPIGATNVLECPKEFDGSYLSLYYSEYSVSAEIHRVNRISDFEIIIYSKRSEFIDSLYLEKRKLSNIDTAWFEDNLIYVKAGQSVREFDLNDSLSSEDERVEVSLDFNEMLYFQLMEDTSEFKLNFIDDSYYLNIEKLPGLYSICQLKFDDKDIKIKTLDFGVSDSINPTDNFIERYRLTPKKEDRGKFYVQNYLANLNNYEFTELMEKEEVFQSFTWHKIESSNNHYYWIILAGISLFTIMLIKKTKQGV